MSTPGAVLLAFLATAGFALNFNLRDRRLLITAGISGALGYGVFRVTGTYIAGDSFATFFAALTVGLLGEFFSRRIKAPSLVMIIPAIVPLVPGGRLYEMMLYFVQEQFLESIQKAVETAFIACAIALGILTASLFSLSLRRMRKENIKGKEGKRDGRSPARFF